MQLRGTAWFTLRELARKAIQTKDKVEEMYYFKEQSRQLAADLMRGLKDGKAQDLLGALVGQWIGIPINPAYYMPDTPLTRELRENLEWDLSKEHGFGSAVCLSLTRYARCANSAARYGGERSSTIQSGL